MPQNLDIALVVLTVAAAIGYLVWRKLSSVKTIRRDWASGHSESCAGCAIIKIKQAQLASKKK